MSRFEGALRALILVSAAVLVTEWVHYRTDSVGLWTRILPGPSKLAPADPQEASPFDITEAQFQHYMRVLEAMQSNRRLSIEEAVQSEDLPLAEFRDIEQRVQRNDVLVGRARDLLRRKAESLWNSRRAILERG